MQMSTSKPRLLTVEIVGDLPVLWSCLQRLRVVEFFDQHFPAPPLWKGALTCGEVFAVWLLFLTSQSDHRLNQVEGWAAQHQACLQTLLGKPFRSLDCHDDRLADLLSRLADA